MPRINCLCVCAAVIVGIVICWTIVFFLVFVATIVGVFFEGK